MVDFKQRVLRAVARIPSGHVLTYKQVARLAGRPRAWRAVGNVLSKNYDPKTPCHRVVGTDGQMRGYNRGLRNKIKLLRKEGMKF